VWLPAAAYIRISSSSTDPTPVRWDLAEATLALPNVAGGEVIYQINSTGTPDVPGTTEMDAVDASFRHWEGIPRSKAAFSRGADTTITVANNDNVNVIYWAEGTKTTVLGSKNYPVTGFVALTVVVNDTAGATTGLMRNADIVLNGNQFNWTTDPAADPNSFDVEEIVTHEVGHVVGLEHSGVVGSTMYARTSPGQVRQRSLEADDIAGASSIYPDQDHVAATGAQNGTVQDSFGNLAFGALAATLDADGRLLVEGISQPNGTYSNPGLPPGSHSTYLEPLDVFPPAATNLFDETDLSGIYDATVRTNLFAQTTSPVTVPAGGSTIKNFLTNTTAPSINISAIGQRAITPAGVIFSNRPTALIRGDSHLYIGVSGPGITTGQVFEILGTGVTVNGIAASGSAGGEPAVTYDVSVDPNAPLGLRSIRVIFGGQRTYATGAIEVLDVFPMAGGILGLPSSPPGEVAPGTSPESDFEISPEPGGLRLAWPAEPSAAEYNLWRGNLATLASGGYNHAPLPGPNGSCGLVANSTLLAGDLTDGISHYYLLSGRNSLGEGPMGNNSAGSPRPTGSPACP